LGQALGVSDGCQHRARLVNSGARRVPLPQVAHVWVLRLYLKVARPRLPERAHCSNPNPIAIDFKLSKFNQIEHWKNHLLCCFTNSQILHAASLEDKNNFHDGMKFNFETKFELKFLEA
jgi:hypothetical protein